VKKITKFNDSYFRIKMHTPNFNHEKFEEVFEKEISGVKNFISWMFQMES